MSPPPDAGDGVLAGVRVLELATGLAAPYATMFLGDQGADVVKVEGPAGDPYRADPGFQTVNRNKRSVVTEGGPAVVDDTVSALASSADVVVCSQPGRAAELRALAPDAVVLTMPPWGERGPRVDAATSRGLLHAATGIAWNQQSYAEVPVDVVVPIAAYGTGVLGALAAVTGILARQRTGHAPTYEVSEVAGAAAVQLGEARLAGPPDIRPGDSGLGSKGRVACYRLIEAGDGRWFFLACGTARFYHRMLEVIGRPDLADDPLLANPPWGLLEDEAIARLTPILDEAFATRPRQEWLDLLAEADVPAQPVLTRSEFLASSMVRANEMDVTVAHPGLGPVSMMGLPVTVADAPGSIRRAAPLLGADTDAVVAAWSAPPAGDRTGQTDNAQTDNTQAGSTQAGNAQTARGDAADQVPGPSTARPEGARPLAGVRVLDLASFIAGPVVSRHLAMLGADVIKIEPPTGDPFRSIGPPFLAWNQGKRSIVCDLTTENGQHELHRLAATADVVVENFRPGVARRLRADRATLTAINPDLVFLSSPGYGLDDDMAERPAFDPLVQALGGLMAAQGGLSDDPDLPSTGAEPVFLSVPIHDVVTPMLGALGVVCGLLQRRRTGAGQHVRTSLVQSTMVAQAAEFTRYDGRPPAALGGFDHPGSEHGPHWVEGPEGPQWLDGDHRIDVCRTGLTGTELAEANDLLTTEDHDGWGPLVLFGQLVGGAGPGPTRAPGLDEHGAAIRAELDARDTLPTIDPADPAQPREGDRR